MNGAERFKEHVTHHYEFLGDRLIIGKFCSIARGIEFVMNGANHRMNSVSTYPFNIMGGGWEAFAPALDDLPLKGDTVVGSDVWIGQNVTVMPGVHIGDGAIIGAHCLIGAGALVTQATVVPDNTLMLGCPAKAVRQLDPDEIRRLDESAAHYVREAAAYREAFVE